MYTDSSLQTLTIQYPVLWATLALQVIALGRCFNKLSKNSSHTLTLYILVSQILHCECSVIVFSFPGRCPVKLPAKERRAVQGSCPPVLPGGGRQSAGRHWLDSPPGWRNFGHRGGHSRNSQFCYWRPSSVWSGQCLRFHSLTFFLKTGKLLASVLVWKIRYSVP